MAMTYRNVVNRPLTYDEADENFRVADKDRIPTRDYKGVVSGVNPANIFPNPSGERDMNGWVGFTGPGGTPNPNGVPAMKSYNGEGGEGMYYYLSKSLDGSADYYVDAFTQIRAVAGFPITVQFEYIAAAFTQGQGYLNLEFYNDSGQVTGYNTAIYFTPVSAWSFATVSDIVPVGSTSFSVRVVFDAKPNIPVSGVSIRRIKIENSNKGPSLMSHEATLRAAYFNPLFGARPTWKTPDGQTRTPWDDANFNPATKYDVAGGFVNGLMTVKTGGDVSTSRAVRVQPIATGENQQGKLGLYGTFGQNPDRVPRLVGEISAGFNNNIWGYEFVSIRVNQFANDAEDSNAMLEALRIDKLNTTVKTQGFWVQSVGANINLDLQDASNQDYAYVYYRRKGLSYWATYMNANNDFGFARYNGNTYLDTPLLFSNSKGQAEFSLPPKHHSDVGGAQLQYPVSSNDNQYIEMNWDSTNKRMNIFVNHVLVGYLNPIT